MNIYRQVPARKNLFPYCNVFLFPNSKSRRSNTEAYLLWPAYSVRCDLGNLLGWGRVSSAEQRGAVGAGTADWRAGLQRPLWAANGEIFVLAAISSCFFILYFYSMYIFTGFCLTSIWKQQSDSFWQTQRHFLSFSAPFEEFLTNLEEALVVLRAWLLKLVLMDSAGKMWTAFSVAVRSSSGQWLSERSTRDPWSDLEEHMCF